MQTVKWSTVTMNIGMATSIIIIVPFSLCHEAHEHIEPFEFDSFRLKELTIIV